MKRLIKTTKALADPNRIKILKLLQMQQLCVCEIKDLIQLAQSTISAHLKILVAAELIDFHKEGLWVIYKLAPLDNPNLQQLIDSALAYLSKDQEILALSKKLGTVVQKKTCCKGE